MILIPETCEKIGHRVFAGSANLRVIFIENGNIAFEPDFVRNCTALERVIAPAGSAVARWAEENGLD